MISSLANLEGEETFEASYLGTAEEVVQERISDDELILVKGTKIVSSSSIILRGANGMFYFSLFTLSWKVGYTLTVTEILIDADRLSSGRDGESST